MFGKKKKVLTPEEQKSMIYANARGVERLIGKVEQSINKVKAMIDDAQKKYKAAVKAGDVSGEKVNSLLYSNACRARNNYINLLTNLVNVKSKIDLLAIQVDVGAALNGIPAIVQTLDLSGFNMDNISASMDQMIAKMDSFTDTMDASFPQEASADAELIAELHARTMAEIEAETTPLGGGYIVDNNPAVKAKNEYN